MKIVRIGMGPFDVNCYVVIDPDAKEAMVIDPGVNSLEIMSVIRGMRLKYIVNTHGHFDHLGGNTFLKNGTGAELVIHEKDSHMLTDPAANMSTLFVDPVISVPADIVIHEENTVLEIGTYAFRVMHVPGHTEGSIALYNEAKKVLFSGDLIFNGSVGRTDFPGGSAKKLENSLKKVLKLPHDITIYPGHEEPFKLSDVEAYTTHIFESLDV